MASEVRALAQRTSESAKEVRGLIVKNVADVASGASLVAQAGTSIRTVREIVTKGAGLVAEIASSAEETSIAVNEINIGMGQLDQVTQKNAAMVLDVARTGKNLSGQSSDLRELVGRFQLDKERERPASEIA